MKFCNFLFKMNLGKDCSIGTIASIMSLVCLLANLTIIASEKKVIKEPKPLNRPYETMVDYAMFINKEQETQHGAISDQLFHAIRACTGVTLKKDQKTEEMFQYKQFVVIATMPIVSNLFNHIDPVSGISNWDKLLTHINTYIDTYTSDDQSFVVFIPKNYKAGEYKEDEIKTKLSNKEEQLRHIGFNTQTLKPLHISEIKPQKKPLTYLSDKAQEIDVKKLESIFIPDKAKIARCIYLFGHGNFKTMIAGMQKSTYLKFLELLENLETRFLFIASCYSGGINAIVMNLRLKEDFIDTLDLKQKKSFDILNIHFPIVVQATSDAITYGHILSFDNEKLFFLNNFFSTLHAFLSSPTWEIGMKKSEWRELMGKKLIATKTKELIEKQQRSPEEEEELEKLSKLIKTPKVAGPLVFMSDVLKQVYSIEPDPTVAQLNLPSIYIPDCKEVPGGIFFEAVKVDTMEIITNKNLTSNIKISDRERKRIISEKGEIKEQGLTEEEKIKQAKFVLVYPVDMSSTTFTITCKEPPTFMSKIGGNAYHIIGNYKDENHDIDIIVRSFIYPQAVSSNSFMMGSSNKAWLIHRLLSETKSLDYVVFYKPASSSIDDENTTFDSFVMYFYKNNYYMRVATHTLGKNDQYTFINFTLSPVKEISSAYYDAYLRAILKKCSPDTLALEKFTASKETPETIKTAADNFLNSATGQITITMDDIALAQELLSKGDSLPIARQASFEILGEVGKQDKQLFDQVIDAINIDDKNTLLHLAIEAGTDNDIIKLLITPQSLVTPNKEGLPPLHYAIWQKADKDIIELLITPESIAVQDKNGLPPLQYILANANVINQDIIKLLTTLTPQTLVTPNKDGLPPLHYAIMRKIDKDILKLLITPESIAAQDIRGLPPLQLAICFGPLLSKDIIRFLINDESIKIQDKDGLTPLHFAISRSKSKDFIKFLIATNDKCLIARDKAGNPPLHYAIGKNENKDIIESLITSETINIKNNDGLTPLQWATKAGAAQDIIDLLKKHGGK